MPVTDRQTGAIHYHFRLLGTLWMVILACLHPRNCLSQSRINELQIAPASSGLEFVEVILIGSEPLDLSKLTLEDSRKKPGQLVFPDGESRILNPGEIVVLAQNPELLQNVFGKMHVVGVKPWPALNNGGDSIALRAGSTLLDSFAYGSNDYTRGISLERIDPNVPAAIQRNWSPSTAPRGATPGSRNSVYERDTTLVFIRLAEYSSDTAIDIYFSEPVNRVTLDPSEILLDHIPYTGIVSEVDLSTIRLHASTNHQIIEFGTLSDFAGNVSRSLSRTIAQRVQSGDLRISEIMFDPERDRNGDLLPEWIEFVNIRPFPISLSGLSLIIGPEKSRAANRQVLQRVYREIRAGQFVLIYNDPEKQMPGETAPNETLSDYDDARVMKVYIESFENAAGLPAAPPLFIGIRGASLSLNNATDLVTLQSSSGITVDSVRYEDAWHDNGLLDTRGRSLSRIRLDSNSMDPLNWVSSRLQAGYAGFTPGAERVSDGIFTSQYPGPGALLLNEIMYDPRSTADDGLPDQSEYLEFKNTSDWEIDLNGLYLISGTEEEENQDSLRLVYRPARLGPAELAVVFHLPDHIPDGDHEKRQFLEAAFPDLSNPGARALFTVRSPLSLSNNGEYLALFAGNRKMQDELSYKTTWHHPLVLDATGRSIEKIDHSASSSLESNWSTTASLSGGTPGMRNSIDLTDALSSGGATSEGLDISPLTITPDRDGEDDHARILVRGGASNSSLRIDIFDLEGHPVRRLVPVTLHTGTFTTFWDGSGDGGRELPVGVYITLVRIYDHSSNTTIFFKKPIAIFRE